MLVLRELFTPVAHSEIKLKQNTETAGNSFRLVSASLAYYFNKRMNMLMRLKQLVFFHFSSTMHAFGCHSNIRYLQEHISCRRRRDPIGWKRSRDLHSAPAEIYKISHKTQPNLLHRYVTSVTLLELMYVALGLGLLYVLVCVNAQNKHKTGWRPLLPYGYIYKSSSARPG